LVFETSFGHRNTKTSTSFSLHTRGSIGDSESFHSLLRRTSLPLALAGSIQSKKVNREIGSSFIAPDKRQQRINDVQKDPDIENPMFGVHGHTLPSTVVLDCGDGAVTSIDPSISTS
jgi:hypothetical protein